MWVKQTDLIFPLICSSNWEFSGTETYPHPGKRKFETSPSTVSTYPDDFKWLKHLPNDVCLAPWLGLLALYPGGGPGVMMMYSLTFLSMFLIQRQRRKRDWTFSDMILRSMFINWCWRFTYELSDVIFGADVKDQSCCQETCMFIWFTVWRTRRKHWTRMVLTHFPISYMVIWFP